MVRHHLPATLSEALDILRKHDCFVFSGGTDLMVQKRGPAGSPPVFDKDVLYLSGVRELDYIRKEANGVSIGSMTTLNTILANPAVPSLLRRMIAEMASPGIRNMATLAGNIGNASPAGDSLVPLMLLDASVVLSSAKGERVLGLDAYITGVRRTERRPDELIREIRIPFSIFTVERINKVGGRRSDAISKVSFGGAARVEDGIVKDLRMALGAVYKTVVRDKALEAGIVGHEPIWYKAHAKEILESYAPKIQPIDDQRSNRTYRKQIALNLIEAFLNDLA